MSLFDELNKIEAKNVALAAQVAALPGSTPVDISGLATAAEVAALSAKFDALSAAVGTPPAA